MFGVIQISMSDSGRGFLASDESITGGSRMAKLCTYEDFLERVDELGFMAFSNILEGLPSLVSETPEGIWHTGDTETDPWRWKDRAAEEKRLAFGCILGGNKGFVSARLYPVFYAACHPGQSMEERRYNGLVSQTAWELWRLSEDRNALDTGEIRRLMNVSKKKGAGRVDAAISELQQYFYITVAGSRQKTDKSGMPYGWHVNVYEKVKSWAPASWLESSHAIKGEDAVEEILDIGEANGNGIDRSKLKKVLGF